MLNRAYGCLAGAAIGDAMGMPASFLTRQMIKDTYGYIEDFLEPEPEAQQYHGNLHAGEITDDTQETIIVANVLIENGCFSTPRFNEAMKRWAIDAHMLESTVIGPSTRRFLTAVVEGKDPAPGAKQGDTNGGAMRVAPVGICYWNNMEQCIKAAADSALPSHGSAPAVAAACAVAAAVAAGIHGGYTVSQVYDFAIQGAQYGEKIGADYPAPLISKRLILAKTMIDQCKDQGMDCILDQLVGIFGASMKAYESAVIALGAFYAADGHAKKGILAAVNAGDDADTNGSICGAICGAYSGADALPQQWISRVENTSGMDFKRMAKQLLNLDNTEEKESK